MNHLEAARRPTAAALATLAALAAAPTLGGPTGLYLGLSQGWTRADTSAADTQRQLQAAGFPNQTRVQDDEDTGTRLYLGYQVNPYLAVEAGYADLGETALLSTLSAPAGQIRTTQDLDAFTLVVTGGYPLGERLSAFAKVGVAFWGAEAQSRGTFPTGSLTTRAEAEGTDLTFGLGAAYRVTDGIAARLDWDRYTLGGDLDTDLDVLSLGVQVHFK